MCQNLIQVKYKNDYLSILQMVASVFEQLVIEDNKLLKTLDMGKKDHKKILDVYALRVNLYREFADREHDPIIKAIIEAKKSVVMSDMGLLTAQYEIQYSIAKINLRLDEYEKNSRSRD